VVIFFAVCVNPLVIVMVHVDAIVDIEDIRQSWVVGSPVGVPQIRERMGREVPKEHSLMADVIQSNPPILHAIILFFVSQDTLQFNLCLS